MWKAPPLPFVVVGPFVAGAAVITVVAVAVLDSCVPFLYFCY